MTKRGGVSGWPVAGQASCHTAGEFLAAGQYEQVAELLHEAQVASEQAGDAILAHTLEAARRICLACNQCRAEAEWHRQAYEGAGQREHELKQQLHTILDLINGRELSETQVPPSAVSTADPNQPAHGTSKSVGRPNLWQRLQGLLGRKPPSQSFERESSVASDEALTPFSPDKIESLTVLSVEKSKQKEQAPPSLVVYCLGPFRVYQNDQLVTGWDSLKARSILKYLVAHQGTLVVRDILMDVFWPDANPEAARRNLHQAVYSLRQVLRQDHPGFQHIKFEDSCYLLNPEMDVWVDSEEFEKHVRAGQRLEAAGQLSEAVAEYGIAEGLYQGDFLEEDLYEDWPRGQREQMRNMYLNAVDRLSEYYVGQTEYTTAIALCRKVLAQDNCYEEAYRRLMQCYLAQGQRHLAVRQYQTCVEALREELDLAPAEETVTLYQRITAAT
jgi:DNA-binding SARP family transcriptional activator